MGMEIYSKSIAYIRGLGSWYWITGWFGPCEASLRAPDLGGGVGGGPVVPFVLELLIYSY